MNYHLFRYSVVPRIPFTASPYSLNIPSINGGDGSPWEVRDSNVYLRNGNVGIGTQSPGARLEIGNRDNLIPLKWFGNKGRPYGIENHENKLILADLGRCRVFEYEPDKYLQLGGGVNVGIGAIPKSIAKESAMSRLSGYILPTRKILGVPYITSNVTLSS